MANPTVLGLLFGLVVVAASFVIGPSWVIQVIVVGIFAGWLLFAILDRVRAP